MKKLLMGFAICTLILTSCSKQEVTENVDSPQGQLSFSTGLGKPSSRAAEWTNTSLQGAALTGTPIAMYAYQETPPALSGTFKEWFKDDLYYDQTAKVWKIKTTRFRNTAETKYVTFFPNTPANLTVEMDAVEIAKTTFETADFATGGKFPAFKYKVAATSILQEDLIVGVTKVAAEQSNIIVGMRHALSQVNFGTVGYNGANITLRDINITGINSEAVYTYKAVDEAPAGVWGIPTVAATYSYFDYSNTDKIAPNLNLQPTVSWEATTGDRYIFGDGGNWGPGKENITFYPTKATGVWKNHAANDAALGNSLMLMPQTLTTTAKVTFEYQITDKTGAFVAGGPDAATWEKGEFKLDFSTGTADEDYKSRWDQNMRYVYMIDFTDFLDGAALSFTVDVDAQPWVNYDNGGNGEVIILVAGQPTAANMNTIANTQPWYIATQKGAPAPTDKEWAQVIRDEVWNMKDYTFNSIENGQTFNLNFKNVIFNTKDAVPAPTTITLTLPNGYTAALAQGSTTTNITIDGTNAPVYVISGGDRTSNAAITITNGNEEYSTLVTLQTAIEAVNTPGSKLTYKGTAAIDLKGMEPALTAAGNIMTVKFNNIVPTVGKTTSGNGEWTWDASTRAATYTRL